MALYIPWDKMTDADPLWVRIVWTVVGGITWIIAFGLLFGNTEEATIAANNALKNPDGTFKENPKLNQARLAPKEHCTRCGFINIPNASFCGECGAAL